MARTPVTTSTVSVPAPERADPATHKDSIRFGRVPYGAYGDMYRDHQPLLDYLSGQLDRKLSLQLFADYAAMVGAIRDGDLELAWLGPLAYLDAEKSLADRKMHRLIPIVKPMRHGKSEYASEIIVRKDSGINTVADLAGRSCAFVDTTSTAGYLLAAAHLMKCGISVKDPLFARRHFLNQYGNVVLAVLFGKFDAGAVFEGAPAVFLKDAEADRRAELMVLTRSDSVPYEPIAALAGGNLQEAEAKKLRTLFLELNGRPDILKKLQVGGFETAAPAEYESIRTVVRMVDRLQAGI